MTTFTHDTGWQIRQLFLSGGYTEVRALELTPREADGGYDWTPRGSSWFDGQNLDDVLSWCDRQNGLGYDVFVGANPRLVPDGKSKKDVTKFSACYADLDLGGERIDEAYQHLMGLPQPPSFCVHSGRGIHAYWLLDEPSPDKELWSRVNEGIYHSLKDDWKADANVKTDESRVLRLVPYPNRKTGAKQVSLFPRAEQVRRYALQDWAAALPERSANAIPVSPEVLPASRKPEWADPNARFPDGTRTEAMMALAGSLRACGLDEHLIRYTITAFNQVQCDPPLPQTKMDGIAKSASQYPADESALPEDHEKLIQGFDEYTAIAPPTLHDGTPLPKGEISVLYGFTGSYKTFIAIHWAFQVASSEPVLFVCGEDYPGVALRVEGYARSRPCFAHRNHFHLVRRGLAMLDPQRRDLVQIADELAERNLKPGLIVFDTMSANFHGMSGASTSADESVRAFLENARWLSQRCGGASTLVIAHTTKDGNTFAGSQVLMNDAACFMQAKETARRDLHTTVTIQKAKNTSPPAPLYFKLEPKVFCPPLTCLPYLPVARSGSGATAENTSRSTRGGSTLVVWPDPWFSLSSSPGRKGPEEPSDTGLDDSTDTQSHLTVDDLKPATADFLKGVYAEGRTTATVDDGAAWLADQTPAPTPSGERRKPASRNWPGTTTSTMSGRGNGTSTS